MYTVNKSDKIIRVNLDDTENFSFVDHVLTNFRNETCLWFTLNVYIDYYCYILYTLHIYILKEQ